MRRRIIYRFTLLSIMSVSMSLSTSALAVTADKVKCTKPCISKSEMKKKSVGSKQIINESIKQKDLTPNVLEGLRRLVYVAKTGGDFTDPVAAMASINNAGPDNPYLLYIGEGTFSLTGPLQMKSFVDIRGSGEHATVLAGTHDGGAGGTSGGLVNGANNARLSDLSIRNVVNGGNTAIGIYNNDVSPVIDGVQVLARDAANDNTGIHNIDSQAVIRATDAEAIGGGAKNIGIRNDGASNDTLVKNSSMRGSFSGANATSGAKSTMVWSVIPLGGTVEETGGFFICSGVLDADGNKVSC